MSRHVVLLKFTEKGFANIKKSPDRAKSFRSSAGSAGVEIETLLWTTGTYDGLVILTAPDEATAAGVVLGLAGDGNVSTCMLDAFDESQFAAVLAKAKVSPVKSGLCKKSRCGQVVMVQLSLGMSSASPGS